MEEQEDAEKRLAEAEQKAKDAQEDYRRRGARRAEERARLGAAGSYEGTGEHLICGEGGVFPSEVSILHTCR